MLRTTKNEAPAKGRERVVILNEVKDLAPKAVQIQSRDPSGEKHAVRMTTSVPSERQLFVVPSERSDRGASPKGARDLPLVRNALKTAISPASPFGMTSFRAMD